MESNIKDLYQRTGEISEASDQRFKDDYYTRQTSMAKIISCNIDKKEYEVEIIDEKLIVVALHIESNNSILFKDSFSPGDLVLVSHRKGGDAQIVARFDRGTLKDDGDSVDKGFFSWMKGLVGGS